MSSCNWLRLLSCRLVRARPCICDASDRVGERLNAATASEEGEEAEGCAQLSTTAIYAHLTGRKRRADVAKYLGGGT
jgi:hypothetical protein